MKNNNKPQAVEEENIKVKNEFKNEGKDVTLINQKGDTIIVDAGHGGNDPGTIGYKGTLEKDINLQMAMKLGQALEEEGYNIVYTRTLDEFVDNTYRADIANESNAKIFLSLHCNSLENNKDVAGLQVLYHPGGLSRLDVPTNEEFARLIMDGILEQKNARDRGIVQRDDLTVLNYTRKPAVLVEVGFLSNPEEEALITTNEYQEKIVKGIVNGVKEYFSQMNKEEA